MQLIKCFQNRYLLAAALFCIAPHHKAYAAPTPTSTQLTPVPSVSAPSSYEASPSQTALPMPAGSDDAVVTPCPVSPTPSPPVSPSASPAPECRDKSAKKSNKWFIKYVSMWAPEQHPFKKGDPAQMTNDELHKKHLAMQAVLDEIQSNANGYDSTLIEKEKSAGRWIYLYDLCEGKCANSRYLCLPSGLMLNSGGPWNIALKDLQTGEQGYHLVLDKQDSGAIFQRWTDIEALEIFGKNCRCADPDGGDC